MFCPPNMTGTVWSKALDLGALGFIPKSGQREVMVQALQLIFAGGVYIPPEIIGRGSQQAVGFLSPAMQAPSAGRPPVFAF